jgi:hypothetical protein
LPISVNADIREGNEPMTTILHPIRLLRENLRQIGAAVSASREYSRAACDNAATASAGIPF